MAAALLLMEGRFAQSPGCQPLARVVVGAIAGVDPSYMGLGPICAPRKTLARAGLRIDGMDLPDLNETFAAQVIPCLRELEMDPTNPRRETLNGRTRPAM